MTRAGETLGALSGEGGIWRDILVRPFLEDDAEALARFWRDREFDVPGGLYHDVPKLDGDYVLETMRENRTLRGTVALKQDRIVGYHELRRMNPTTLWGCYFNLAPEIRGQGFGARFAFVALQFMAGLPRGSFRRIVAFVSPGNHVARRLYHRFGFLEPRPGELEILTLTLLSVPAFARFAKLHDSF